MPKYLMPLAECTQTGQTVKAVDLVNRLETHQTTEARLIAQKLARDLETRTGLNWQSRVEVYTVAKDHRTRL